MGERAPEGTDDGRPTGLESTADRRLERTLGRLYAAADHLTRKFRERHGLACSPRCARCCSQLVPVWPVEAAALIPGVRALYETNEERLALRDHARRQLAEPSAVLAREGVLRHPSDMPVWRVQHGQLERLVSRKWPPCVLLAEGRCRVYTRRPLLCRMCGYPTTAIPSNLCHRLVSPLIERAGGGPLPAIPARLFHRLGESIRRLQDLPDGVTDITTVAGVVAHSLR